jgi:hypothetical protein
MCCPTFFYFWLDIKPRWNKLKRTSYWDIYPTSSIISILYITFIVIIIIIIIIIISIHSEFCNRQNKVDVLNYWVVRKGILRLLSIGERRPTVGGMLSWNVNFWVPTGPGWQDGGKRERGVGGYFAKGKWVVGVSLKFPSRLLVALWLRGQLSMPDVICQNEFVWI